MLSILQLLHCGELTFHFASSWSWFVFVRVALIRAIMSTTGTDARRIVEKHR